MAHGANEIAQGANEMAQEAIQENWTGASIIGKQHQECWVEMGRGCPYAVMLSN